MSSVLILTCFLAFALAASMWTAADVDHAGAAPTTESEKSLYAIGLMISQNLETFDLKENELKQVIAGLTDGVLKRPAKVDLQEYAAKIQDFARDRMSANAEKEKTESAQFVAGEAAKKDHVQTDSGLVYTILQAGTGKSPKATDTVTVHYTGTLRDGTVFDSSVERGEPASFPLNRVIAAWTEGVQLMKVGGKTRLICPSDLAYGDNGSPPTIPGGAALIFDVELISID